jgi:hypothetical protein
MPVNIPIPTEERKRIVHILLNAPPTVPHKALSEKTGINREMVRRIRTGDRWADILPDLPRQGKRRNQRCTDCVNCDFLKWSCKLDIPESIAEDGGLDRRYAICCSNYVEDKEIAALIKARTTDPAFKEAIQRFKDMGLTFRQISLIVRKSTTAFPPVQYTVEYKRHKYPSTPQPSPMFDTYPPTPQAAADLQPQRFSLGETWRGPDGPDRQPGRNYRVCTAPDNPLHVRLMSIGGGTDEIVPIAATVGYTLVAPAKPGWRF